MSNQDTVAQVFINPDKEFVQAIKESIAACDGHCPCQLPRTDDTLCMCKDFRDKVSDPNFYGKCHCGLYEKRKPQ